MQQWGDTRYGGVSTFLSGELQKYERVGGWATQEAALGSAVFGVAIGTLVEQVGSQKLKLPAFHLPGEESRQPGGHIAGSIALLGGPFAVNKNVFGLFSPYSPEAPLVAII
ncbi:MAG: hypothetical protein LBB84_03760 [Tannerellaceae bacterium]|jgi:hypothetical protein|nr:hypothetical protein [Tannerellaceae bacterium]